MSCLVQAKEKLSTEEYTHDYCQRGGSTCGSHLEKSSKRTDDQENIEALRRKTVQNKDSIPACAWIKLQKLSQFWSREATMLSKGIDWGNFKSLPMALPRSPPTLGFVLKLHVHLWEKAFCPSVYKEEVSGEKTDVLLSEERPFWSRHWDISK